MPKSTGFRKKRPKATERKLEYDQVLARLEVMTRQMQRNEGVNEKMKAQDQMIWVGRINSIRQRAEELWLMS